MRTLRPRTLSLLASVIASDKNLFRSLYFESRDGGTAPEVMFKGAGEEFGILGQSDCAIVLLRGGSRKAAGGAGIAAVEGVVNGVCFVRRRLQRKLGIARDRAGSERRLRGGNELGIDPGETCGDVVFHPVDFFLVSRADKVIRPDGAAKDRPALKITALRFV